MQCVPEKLLTSFAGVPSTIANLARANIKLWVLTGDKMETAENIGFACNLLTEEMNRSYIDGDSPAIVAEQVAAAAAAVALRAKSSRGAALEAILVDGKALLSIMAALDVTGSEKEEQLMHNFISLAAQCKAVIACRVSPDQKRQIVTMMRKHSGQTPAPMTLAIGDGANDVPMIMEAQVGIGISGNEGMQAVRSADYAIAQFRFLETLMLVHGRNNYKRISVVVMYSLYKNAFFVTCLFCYSVFTGFSGTSLFDSLMFSGFNVARASLAVLLFGIIDRDVSVRASLGCPALYRDGQVNADFNLRVLGKWYLSAIMHAAMCLFLPAYTYLGAVTRAGDDGAVVFGAIVLFALVISVNLKMALTSSILPAISLAIYSLGAVAYLVVGFLHSLWPLSGLMSGDYFDVFPNLLPAAVSWLAILLVTVALFIPGVWRGIMHRS